MKPHQHNPDQDNADDAEDRNHIAGVAALPMPQPTDPKVTFLDLAAEPALMPLLTLEAPEAEVLRVALQERVPVLALQVAAQPAALRVSPEPWLRNRWLGAAGAVRSCKTHRARLARAQQRVVSERALALQRGNPWAASGARGVFRALRAAAHPDLVREARGAAHALGHALLGSVGADLARHALGVVVVRPTRARHAQQRVSVEHLPCVARHPVCPAHSPRDLLSLAHFPRG
eukprot:3821263-Rhodomonas_salina.1